MFGISGYSNGYHQNQQQQQQHSSEEKRGGGRRRRGCRRSRHRHDFGVFDHHHQQHYQNNEKQEHKSPPPCTNFDIAYFHSYAYVGIHEEMIKDRVRTDTYRAAIMEHQSFIEGKVIPL